MQVVLAGKAHPRDDEAKTILKSLFARDIVPPRQVCPDLPDQLDAIIRKALAPDREDRHATAAELQADIELYLAEIGGRMTPRELGDLVAKTIGKGKATLMRGHGITTAFADVRSATVAACYLEESAALQLRMLAAAGGDAAKLRAFTREEAEPLADQIAGNVARRAWEYFAAVALDNPLGSGQK